MWVYIQVVANANINVLWIFFKKKPLILNGTFFRNLASQPFCCPKEMNVLIVNKINLDLSGSPHDWLNHLSLKSEYVQYIVEWDITEIFCLKLHSTNSIYHVFVFSRVKNHMRDCGFSWQFELFYTEKKATQLFNSKLSV